MHACMHACMTKLVSLLGLVVAEGTFGRRSITVLAVQGSSQFWDVKKRCRIICKRVLLRQFGAA